MGAEQGMEFAAHEGSEGHHRAIPQNAMLGMGAGKNRDRLFPPDLQAKKLGFLTAHDIILGTHPGDQKGVGLDFIDHGIAAI